MTEKLAEFSGAFADILVIRELRGDYPDVPFFEDVDIAELTQGDDDPLYLTIPIGKANVISGNKRFYDEAWLQELERQVRQNRPIGIMGHLSSEEASTKFPEEAVFWLGVRRIGELLWAKGYIPKASAARERIRRYKASNKAIATSIYAMAEGVWNKARGAMDMLAETLKLQQIDIVPADRAGIPDLAAIPLLTTEMDAPGEATEQEHEMSMQELRAVKVPPNKGWTPPAQEVTEMGQLQDIRETLGADDSADLRQLVSELLQEREQAKQAQVAARISELVTEGIKLADARDIVTEYVEARQPKTVAEAERAYAEVIEMPSVKKVLALTVQSLSGPAAIVNGKVREMGGRKPLEDTPENRARAAAAMGINI